MTLVDDASMMNALMELLTKGGGTFAGAIGALGIIWKLAIAPLATRLLDMHEKLGNNVSAALHEHARVLDKICDRIERIEERVEEFTTHR